jgi:hypothetical protein
VSSSVAPPWGKVVVQMTFLVDLLVIAVLFVFSVAMTYQRPRSWLIEAVRGMAARYGRPEHTPAWEQEHAELWLMARRRQLTEDLGRIERLLLHDETMSATRQLGNRLARDQLIASLARIPDVLPGRDRSLTYESVESALAYDVAAPSPAMAVRTTSVEVLDVSGWR